jgi:hypothetical protein
MTFSELNTQQSGDKKGHSFCMENIKRSHLEEQGVDWMIPLKMLLEKKSSWGSELDWSIGDLYENCNGTSGSSKGIPWKAHFSFVEPKIHNRFYISISLELYWEIHFTISYSSKVCLRSCDISIDILMRLRNTGIWVRFPANSFRQRLYGFWEPHSLPTSWHRWLFPRPVIPRSGTREPTLHCPISLHGVMFI